MGFSSFLDSFKVLSISKVILFFFFQIYLFHYNLNFFLKKRDVKSVIKTILMLALIDSNKEPVHTDSYFTLLDKRILFEIFSWVWLLDERSIQDFESPTFKWVVNSVTPNYYFIPHDYAIYCLLQATKVNFFFFFQIYIIQFQKYETLNRTFMEVFLKFIVFLTNCKELWRLMLIMIKCLV